MNAFETHKTIWQSLTTAVAALVLALGLSAAPYSAANAEDMTAVEFTQETQINSNQDMNELRRLLSLPELSEAQRLRLDRSLESMDEEMADASDAVQGEQQGIIDTVNTLLGVKTPRPTAQG